MPYLLVHGLGLSSSLWSRLTPLLGGEAIAVDLPGHGESEATDFSWGGLWKNIAVSLVGREWSETTLVLHSFSACLLPEIISAGVRPKKIILVEGILHPADALWSNDLTLLDDAQYYNWLIRFRSVSEIALRSQLFSSQQKRDIQIWSGAFKQVNGEALRTIARNLRIRLRSVELGHSIKLLANSIIYIRGERSRLSTVGLTFLEGNSIIIKEIPMAGHFPMIDNPHALSRF